MGENKLLTLSLHCDVLKTDMLPQMSPSIEEAVLSIFHVKPVYNL